MEMKDIGVDRRDQTIGQPTAVEPSRTFYPSISFNDSVVTALQGKDVGDTVSLVVEFKIMAKRLPEDWDELSKWNYISGEIRKVGEPE